MPCRHWTGHRCATADWLDGARHAATTARPGPVPVGFRGLLCLVQANAPPLTTAATAAVPASAPNKRGLGDGLGWGLPWPSPAGSQASQCVDCAQGSIPPHSVTASSGASTASHVAVSVRDAIPSGQPEDLARHAVAQAPLLDLKRRTRAATHKLFTRFQIQHHTHAYALYREIHGGRPCVLACMRGKPALPWGRVPDPPSGLKWQPCRS